jgi:hypothetical protein
MWLKIGDTLLPKHTSEILFIEMKDFYEEQRCLGINDYEGDEFTEDTANNLLKDFVLSQYEDIMHIDSSNGISFTLNMSTG